MKKILFTALSIACFSAMAVAQTNPAGNDAPVKPATPPAKVEMSKEEKAGYKAKQEADLQEAFKGAGLSEEQIKGAKEIMAEASKKSNELKANDKLSDMEREAAKKLINDEKNGKLKALMGEDKYKMYSEIRKKQKEAASVKPN